MFSRLFLFVIVVAGITFAPEWQNNVVMNAETRGWNGLLGTLVINAVLAVLAYLTSVILCRYKRVNSRIREGL